MKKTLLMLTVAGMTMAGCTNSEVLDQATEVQTGKINFERLVGKNTRVPMDNSSLASFYVFGKYEKNGKSTQIFNDIKVYKAERKADDGRTTDWTYDEQARYWIAGANYKFSAYSNGNGQISGSRANYNPEAGELVIGNYLVDNEHQEDLIYAVADRNGAQDKGNAPVSLTFKHLLSKLHVTFESTFPEGYEIEVSDVCVNNVRNEGSYNAEKETREDGSVLKGASGRGIWTGVTRTAENLEIDLSFLKTEGDQTVKVEKATIAAKKGDVPAVTATTADIYVMPFTYKMRNIDLMFHIKVIDPAGEEVFQESLKGSWDPKWEMGTIYNYKVVLNGTAAGMQKIEFTVDPATGVGDWNSANGQTLTFDRVTESSSN